MKNKNLVIAVFVIATAMLSGCAKDGATGPAGPAGADGSANVTVQTFSVNSWSSSAYNWYANLNATAVTSTVQSSGTVQAFFSTNNGTTWVAIPVTIYGNVANYWFSLLTQSGLVEVQWWYNGGGIGSDPNTYFSATTQIKVVVIPPAIMKTYPNVNLTNYDELKATFNLKD